MSLFAAVMLMALVVGLGLLVLPGWEYRPPWTAWRALAVQLALTAAFVWWVTRPAPPAYRQPGDAYPPFAVSR